MSDQNKDPLIIIASNRGPYSFKAMDDGSFEVERGAGGAHQANRAINHPGIHVVPVAGAAGQIGAARASGSGGGRRYRPGPQ